MPARTRNADLIDAIRDSRMLPASQIRRIRRQDRLKYANVLELEHKLKDIKDEYGVEVREDLKCHKGRRHDPQDIADEIPIEVDSGIEETHFCVRCGTAITAVRDEWRQTVGVPIYVHPPKYEAILDTFEPWEAKLLHDTFCWMDTLLGKAVECGVEITPFAVGHIEEAYA